MQSFAEWFETVYQQAGEGRSAAVLRLSQAAAVSMPAIWRGLRGSRLSGDTVTKLLGVAGAGAFDGLAVVTAPHVAPAPRGRRRAPSADSSGPHEQQAAEPADAAE